VTPTVAFFISGHGFGHASRQVEIINALTAGPRPPAVVLRTAVDPGLLSRTLRRPYALVAGPCDSGLVQRDSVTHDDRASVAAARDFYATFEARVGDEVRRLDQCRPALIVGDIPPLAFVTAARLGIPSLAIANFTWDWIYEVMPGFEREAPGVLATIRAAYAQATGALALPFTGGFEVFATAAPLPLVARQATLTPASTRASLSRLGVPPDGPLALLSFGGYGLPSLDVTAVTGLDEWTILTTDRTSGDRSGASRVVTLPESIFREGALRYEDLVAASDVVVSKPGYGIIAECAANDSALVYTSRGAFREYDVLVGDLPRYVRSAFLSQADLRAGRWQPAFAEALAAPRPERPRVDGAAVAARIIGEWLAGAAR
jgi:UDP:flavonoid glycosyltransferase YjiC (YdhE family)